MFDEVMDKSSVFIVFDSLCSLLRLCLVFTELQHLKTYWHRWNIRDMTQRRQRYVLFVQICLLCGPPQVALCVTHRLSVPCQLLTRQKA